MSVGFDPKYIKFSKLVTASSLLTGLLGAFECTDNGGSTFTNAAGTGNGTHNGSTPTSGGVTFNALDDYIDFASVASMQFSTTAMSIYVKFRLTALPSTSGRYYTLCHYGASDAPYCYTKIVMNYDGVDNGIVLSIKDVGGADRSFYASDNQYIINTDHKLIIVLSAGAVAKMYLDGTDIYGANIGGNTSGNVSGFAYFTVGNDFDTNTTGLEGTLKKYIFWNRALTAGEITALTSNDVYPY